MFKAGLTLPLLPMIRELLAKLNLAPSQIKPNGWVLLISFNILWPMVIELGMRPIVKKFLTFYMPGKFGHEWSFQEYYPGRPSKLISLCEKWHPGDHYEQGFFFVFGTDWELFGKEEYFNTPPSIPLRWGAPRKSRFGTPSSLNYSEKDNTGKVAEWAELHLDKLCWDFLISKENLEHYMGYPPSKWK